MSGNQSYANQNGANQGDAKQSKAHQGDAKQQIRAAVRASRALRSTAAQQAARDQLTAQLSTLVTARGARAVSCYLPMPGEPDTSGFIEWAQTHSIDVLLPISREDRGLNWARLGAAGTAAGLHGIQEPLGEHLPAEAITNADLLIIPACAVDAHGMRLGWGLGYYDRLLASLNTQTPVFAVIHDDEFLPHVPAAAHDIPVNGIVTPTRTRLFSIDPG